MFVMHWTEERPVTDVKHIVYMRKVFKNRCEAYGLYEKSVQEQGT